MAEGLDTEKIQDREGEWKVHEGEWERGWEAVRKQREGEQREIGTQGGQEHEKVAEWKEGREQGSDGLKGERKREGSREG